MGFLTGETAAIDGFSCLRRWQVRTFSPLVGGVCTSSQNTEVLIEGIADWQGVAFGYGYPPKDPGDTFTFHGEIDETEADGPTGAAIVDRVRIHWDVEQGELMYYYIWFSGQGQTGALAMTGATATDGGSVSPVSAKDIQFYIGSDRDIRRAWLEIAMRNAPYADSGTSGRMARAAGVGPTAQFWADMYFSAMSQLPTKGNYYEVKGYIDTAQTENTSYRVKYCLIDAVEPEIITEADAQGRPQGNHAIITGRFTGYGGTSVDGWIKTPNDGSFWVAS